MNSQCQKFIDFYTKLNLENLYLIEEIYEKDAVFQDPIHKCDNIGDIKIYFEGLLKSFNFRFEFSETFNKDNSNLLIWRMYLKSPKINKGNEFSVYGNSHIIFNPKTEKISYQRDNFDTHEAIFNYIPGVSLLTRYIISKSK